MPGADKSLAQAVLVYLCCTGTVASFHTYKPDWSYYGGADNRADKWADSVTLPDNFKVSRQRFVRLCLVTVRLGL